MSNVQTDTWAGSFGDDYTARNLPDANQLAYRQRFWQEALRSIEGFPTCEKSVRKVLEIGAGSGTNLTVMRPYFAPAATELAAIDVNPAAIRYLHENPDITYAMEADFLRAPIMPIFDLVFTRGVLIHIDPTRLDAALSRIHIASRRYILLAEYYAPDATPVSYRGQEGLLWRNDFAGLMLDKYPDLQLIDYGFKYHRDANPQDDITWFLLEKNQ